jgi:hypothetical protein
MANYHTFGFCSGRGMFGRTIHSIPISKINKNHIVQTKNHIVSHLKTLATHGISSLTHSETKNHIVQTKNHIVSHLKTLATHGALFIVFLSLKLTLRLQLRYFVLLIVVF